MEVYAAPPEVPEGWPSLARVVRVVRSGEREGTRYRRVSLYVTSRTDGAATLARMVRQHWHVENRLHWCKDAVQQEDAGRVRSASGAWLLSVLRGLALSVLRYHGEWSPTAARSRLANRVEEMMRLLRT